MNAPGVPILMYHGLFERARELARWPRAVTRFWVDVREFERQVAALAARGYAAVPLAALVSGRLDGVSRPIVLTFDDGWASDWQLARPVLARFGWRSEHFVIAGSIGRPDFLSWADVRALDAGRDAVHSHTLTHPDLDRLPHDAVHEELSASRAVLENALGHRVGFLSLPGGTGARPTTLLLAQALGYRAVCTSRVGLNDPDGDPYRLRRIPVTSATSIEQLVGWVAGSGLRRVALACETRRLARRVVPPGLYDRAREWAFG